MTSGPRDSISGPPLSLGYTGIQAGADVGPVFGSVLVQRLRGWTVIEPKLDGRHVLAVMTLCPADTKP